MILLWKIRYLDRRDREFKDRSLYLDTEKLPPETRAAVEFAIETDSHRSGRDFLEFRALFQENNSDTAPLQWMGGTGGHAFCIHGYHEDENGAALSSHEMGTILTGSPTTIAIPPGAEQHDIEFMLSTPTPIPIAEVTLSPEKVQLLGYFVRDLRELSESAFMKDGPGTLQSTGALSIGANARLKTAVTDEEIRSFVTIFRRLYLEQEPANFKKAVAVFARLFHKIPYGKWVVGVRKSYEARMKDPVQSWPMPTGSFSFTRRELIDAFLYTQYSHQPKTKNQEQFEKCLKEVGGKKDWLTWLFLIQIWDSTLQIGNAGRIIACWLGQYCEHHHVTPNVLPSVRHDHPGIGATEKETARNARVFLEKAAELASAIWQERGCPAGGPTQFLVEAQVCLKKTLSGV